MNSQPLCPCNSGYQYLECCGDENRAGSFVAATISQENGVSPRQSITEPIQSTLQNFAQSPDWFTARIQIHADTAQLIKMSPDWYRKSVFLDPVRIRGRCTVESDIAWLQSQCDQIIWQPSAYIFHTAFCGSTLMSQALDALFNCLPIREPEALGNVLVHWRCQLSHSQQQDAFDIHMWIERVMKLLSRRFDVEETAVIKANDFANPLIAHVLGAQYSIPVLFMYTPLDEFVAGCLKADNRKEWIEQRFNSIVEYAGQMFTEMEGLKIQSGEYAKMAAVYWSYNIAQFLHAFKHYETRLRSLLFTDMLVEPERSIAACAKFFNLQPRADVNNDAALQKLFGVYSKDTTFKYSPQRRQQDLHNVLDMYKNDASSAEQIAQAILGEDYPVNGLPGSILTQ